MGLRPVAGSVVVDYVVGVLGNGSIKKSADYSLDLLDGEVACLDSALTLLLCLCRVSTSS